MTQFKLLTVRDRQPPVRKGNVRQSEHYDHVELWTLRLLTSFESYLYDPWEEDRSRWLELAGLSRQGIDSTDTGKLRTRQARRLKEVEAGALKRQGPLFINIGYLANVLALSPVELEILVFAAVATRNHYLRGGLRAMNMGTREFAIQVLSCALRLPESAVRVACQKSATLSVVGLLFNQDGHYLDVEGLLNLEDGLAQHFFSEHDSQEAFMARFFVPAPRGHLTAKDYPHLDRDFRVMTGYLRHAIDCRMPGVNVLNYGPPGTGKTQFARVLADSLGIALYEVGYLEGESGSTWGPAGRLMSYRMCQTFLARARAGMVVVEEMEDVFPTEGTMLGERRERFVGNKAEINNLLEQNPVPSIWISNDVGYLDSAYLRRFDYALELLMPPRSVRRNIVRHHFADLPVPESYLDSLAANEELTPAQVERVAKVARHSGIGARGELTNAVERLVDNSLSLMGQCRVPPRVVDTVPFGIEFLNVATPIDSLIEGLKQTASCRLCFYGPPGTGKTCLGHHLAKALDRPLMVRRASALLGKFVGETEQNLARMFRAARDDGAVLLLDEADSFLRDRQTARQGWEVTQVNELLTQMEDFEGVLLCATNLMDQLDPAALRRFDFKVRFDYLTSEQRWRLFVRYLDELGYSCLGARESPLRGSVDKLTNLTPGDFAVAARQLRILGVKVSPSMLLAILAEECRGKPESGARIGFV